MRNARLSKKRTAALWTLSAALLVVALLGGGVAAAYFLDPFGRRASLEETRSRLTLGLTEEQVVLRMGCKPSREYLRDTAPSDYYVQGWARRERSITHKVLIFELGEPICYVWFNKDGLVEDFFVGGS